jgi:hypothetical protein
MKRIALAALLLAGTSAALADSGPEGYYTVGYTFVQGKVLDYSADLGAVHASLGWQPSRYFALEATGLAGVSDGTVNGVKLKLNTGYLASLVPRLPITDEFSLYGRLGYSHASLTASGGGVSVSASDHDTVIGGGAEWVAPVGSTWLGARIEYARYYNRDGLTLDGVSVSFIQRF